MINTLAGIAWDPEIRGILTVAVGVVVLMGSVYLLLATNVGNRLGFLLALTGFFGWMTILGLFWWLKPSATGPQGDIPEWLVEEINTGNLDTANLEEANELGLALDETSLPTVEELDGLTAEQFAEVRDDLKEPLDGWKLVAASDPARGEAQSVVDTHLTDGTYPGIDANTDYRPMYAFEVGGKPALPDNPDRWDRISNKVTNTLRITSPPHYLVIQVCPTDPATRPEAAEPGEDIPSLECAQDADTISVVMVRDLGERRLLPFLITLISGLIFGLLCVMLHLRDKTVDEHLNAPLPAPSGG